MLSRYISWFGVCLVCCVSENERSNAVTPLTTPHTSLPLVPTVNVTTVHTLQHGSLFSEASHVLTVSSRASFISKDWSFHLSRYTIVMHIHVDSVKCDYLYLVVRLKISFCNFFADQNHPHGSEAQSLSSLLTYIHLFNIDTCWSKFSHAFSLGWRQTQMIQVSQRRSLLTSTRLTQPGSSFHLHLHVLL